MQNAFVIVVLLYFSPPLVRGGLPSKSSSWAVPFQFQETLQTAAKPTYTSFRNGDEFGVKKDGGDKCLVARFKGRLIIRQLGPWIKAADNTEIVNIPDHATVEGRCTTEGERDAQISLLWATIEGTRYQLQMHFIAKKAFNKVKQTNVWQWFMDRAKLIFSPPSSQSNVTIVAQSTSQTPIRAPLSQSFYCRHSVNVTFSSANASLKADATLQLAAFSRIQPFQVEKTNGFGNTYLCERSRRIGIVERLRSDWTIAMGVVLIVCSGAMLAGYTVKRQFFTTPTAYATMRG